MATIFITFVTFDGECHERVIKSDEPRKEFETAMMMVFHRELTSVQAVIMYDIRHTEICRFEVSAEIYGYAYAVKQYQATDKTSMSAAQRRLLWDKQHNQVTAQRHAYMS